MIERLRKLRSITWCRTRRLPALIACAALAAPVVSLLASQEPVDAAFPGYNGLVALSANGEPGTQKGIWTMGADGSGLSDGA